MKYAIAVIVIFLLASCGRNAYKEDREDKETESHRIDRIYWIKAHRHDSARKTLDSLLEREKQLQNDALVSMLARMKEYPKKSIIAELKRTEVALDRAFFSIDSILKDNKIYNQQ